MSTSVSSTSASTLSPNTASLPALQPLEAANHLHQLIQVLQGSPPSLLQSLLLHWELPDPVAECQLDDSFKSEAISRIRGYLEGQCRRFGLEVPSALMAKIKATANSLGISIDLPVPQYSAALNAGILARSLIFQFLYPPPTPQYTFYSRVSHPLVTSLVTSNAPLRLSFRYNPHSRFYVVCLKLSRSPATRDLLHYGKYRGVNRPPCKTSVNSKQPFRYHSPPNFGAYVDGHRVHSLFGDYPHKGMADITSMVGTEEVGREVFVYFNNLKGSAELTDCYFQIVTGAEITTNAAKTATVTTTAAASTSATAALRIPTTPTTAIPTTPTNLFATSSIPSTPISALSNSATTNPTYSAPSPTTTSIPRAPVVSTATTPSAEGLDPSMAAYLRSMIPSHVLPRLPLAAQQLLGGGQRTSPTLRIMQPFPINSRNKRTRVPISPTTEPFRFTSNILYRVASREDVFSRFALINGQSDNDEISSTIFRISIKCPITLQIMTLPIRTTLCRHLQCFDIRNVTTRGGSYSCPICFQALSDQDLFIDGLTLEIIRKYYEDDHHKNGSSNGGEAEIDYKTFQWKFVGSKAASAVNVETNKTKVIDVDSIEEASANRPVLLD